MESFAGSGRAFWLDVEQKNKKMQKHEHDLLAEWAEEGTEPPVKNLTSYKVIQKLKGRKKAWIDMSEDLLIVAQQMKKY